MTVKKLSPLTREGVDSYQLSLKLNDKIWGATYILVQRHWNSRCSIMYSSVLLGSLSTYHQQEILENSKGLLWVGRRPTVLWNLRTQVDVVVRQTRAYCHKHELRSKSLFHKPVEAAGRQMRRSHNARIYTCSRAVTLVNASS